MTAGGFLLNNELTDFSFVPSDDGKPVANRVEAGKRPRSSMAPTIVYDRDGRVFMVAGSPGRQRDHQLRRQDADRRARLGPRPAGGDRAAELRQPQRPDRARAGHAGRRARAEAAGRWAPTCASIDFTSGAQAIVRTKRGWIGGADPRREGTVRGQ